MKKRILTVILVFFVLASSITFDLVQADTPRYLERLTTSIELDPQYASNSDQYEVMGDLYEGLVRINNEGKQAPGVAESWHIDTNAKRITFKLKQGLLWSDGHEVTAEDFVYAWHSSLENVGDKGVFFAILKKVQGAQAIIDGIPGAKAQSGIKALDPYTLEITFDELDYLFPLRTHNPGLFPVPAHFIEKHGAHWTKQNNFPTNGAYSIEHIERDGGETYLILSKNPKHRDVDQIKISSVRYRVHQLETKVGNINDTKHIAHIYRNIDNSKVKSSFIGFINNEHYRTVPNNNLRVEFILINVRKLGQPVLVEALKYLIDPKMISSRRQVPFAPIDRMFNAIDHPIDVSNRYSIDSTLRIKKAVALLESINVNTDKPITLSIKRTSRMTEEAIAHILAEYGIILESEDVLTSTWRSSNLAKETDLFNIHWYVSVPDPSGFMLLPNWSGLDVFSNQQQKQFDDLLRQASLQDGMERLQTLGKAESLLINEGGVVPLASLSTEDLVHRDLCGWSGSMTLVHPSMWLEWCDKADAQ